MSPAAPSTEPALAAERAVLFAAATVTALVPLNSTMIAIALPDIIDELDISVSAAGWLVTAYLAAMAVLQPAAGRLGDRLGRRRVVAAGLGGFAAASFGAAVAPGFGALLGFRLLQAITGALMVPNAAAMLRTVVPAERRGRRFGVLGGVIGLAAAVGPLVGGGLVAAAGWRAVFAVNVPAVILAGVATARAPVHGRAPEETAPVQGGVLRNAGFRAAAGSMALANLAMYTVLLVVPLALDDRGWGASAAGATLAALTLSMTVFAAVGGRVADRVGRRRPAVTGLALLAAAVVPLAASDGGLAAAAFVVALLVCGAGLGLANTSLQTSALESVPLPQAGSAAGLFSTLRYAGSIVGTAAVTVLVRDRGGFGAAFAMAAVSAAIASAVALRMRDPLSHSVSIRPPRADARRTIGGPASEAGLPHHVGEQHDH